MDIIRCLNKKMIHEFYAHGIFKDAMDLKYHDMRNVQVELLQELLRDNYLTKMFDELLKFGNIRKLDLPVMENHYDETENLAYCILP